MRKPYIKICCIKNKAEARLAINYGASALGLVSAMPSGPGVITEEMIREIAKWTPPPVSTFLLISETEADQIIAQHKRLRTSTIQLVDSVTLNTYKDLRMALPGVKLVQVIHVIDEFSVADAINRSHYVDALLLDSGNPNLSVKELGGTGRLHDWDLSQKIRQNSQVPIFLAGGINAKNVKNAINKVKPYGIDLCSSIRVNGELDEYRLLDFFNVLNSL